MNIKRGNSLVARYSLDMDLAAPLKKKGWNIAHWMNAVRAYQNAKTRHEKREAEKVMAEIREALAGAAYDATPDRLKLIPLKGELAHLEAPDLIARAEKDTKAEARIARLRAQIEAIEERLRATTRTRFSAKPSNGVTSFPKSSMKKAPLSALMR